MDQKTESAQCIMGNKKMDQVGLVVQDIEAAKTKWAQFLNVPVPPTVVTDGYDKSLAEYKGERSDATAKLAFFNLENTQIELIQPDEHPSTWRDALEKNGDCLHHIAFHIKGMGAMIEAFEAMGINLVQKGEYVGGRYAYMDAQDSMGLVVELLEND